jgi:hypothetical protein
MDLGFFKRIKILKKLQMLPLGFTTANHFIDMSETRRLTIQRPVLPGLLCEDYDPDV